MRKQEITGNNNHSILSLTTNKVLHIGVWIKNIYKADTTLSKRSQVQQIIYLTDSMGLAKRKNKIKSKKIEIKQLYYNSGLHASKNIYTSLSLTYCCDDFMDKAKRKGKATLEITRPANLILFSLSLSLCSSHGNSTLKTCKKSPASASASD